MHVILAQRVFQNKNPHLPIYLVKEPDIQKSPR